MSPQAEYSDGEWPSRSRFVYEPDEKLLPGHVKVISTFSDLERALTEAFGKDVHVNWPLIVAGMRNRGIA